MFARPVLLSAGLALLASASTAAQQPVPQDPRTGTPRDMRDGTPVRPRVVPRSEVVGPQAPAKPQPAAPTPGTLSIPGGARTVPMDRPTKVNVAQGPVLAIVNKGAISVGQTRIDTITVVGNRNQWSLSLSAGQTISLSLEACCVRGDPSQALLDPYLRLYSPSTTLLASADDRGFFSPFAGSLNSLILNFTASTPGTYVVEAAGFNDGYAGVYRLRVLSTQVPDLRVDSFPTPANPSRGGLISVLTDGRNAGTATADTSLWFYVFVDAGLTSATVIGACGFLPIVAANTARCSGSVFLPPNIQGSGTIWALLDREPMLVTDPSILVWDGVPELDEHDAGYNNDAGRSITITPQAFPNLAYGQDLNGTLTLGTRTYATFSGTQGDSITIQLSSTAFDTYAYLFDAAGQLLAFDDDGGGGLNSFIGYRINATGQYYIGIGAFVDNGSGAFTAQLRLAGGGTTTPDLVVTNHTSVPGAITAGERLTITATVANNGTATAPASTTGIYLCQGAGCIVIGLPTPSVAAGASVQVRGYVFVPAAFTTGTVDLIAAADDANGVTESNESNNQRLLSMNVTALPLATPSGQIAGGAQNVWGVAAQDLDGVGGGYYAALGDTARVYRMTPAGGVTDLFPTLNVRPVTAIATGGGDIFAASYGQFAGTSSQVRRITPAGAPTTLFTTAFDSLISGVVVIDSVVYIGRYEGLVVSTGLAGGAALPVATVTGNPSGMARSRNGTLLIPLWVGGGVAEVTSGGAQTRLIPDTSFQSPAGIVQSAAGTIYVGDLRGVIHRVSVGGQITAIARIPDGRVYGLAIGSDSVLWIGAMFPADPAQRGRLYRYRINEGPITDSTSIGVIAGFEPESLVVGRNAPIGASMDVVVDLRGIPATLLGQYSATIHWDSTVVRLDSITAGNFAAPVTNQPNAGQLNMAASSGGGVGGLVSLGRLWFRALDSGVTTVNATFSQLASTGAPGTNLLPSLTVRTGLIRLAAAELRGDVSNDGTISALDAQAVLSAVVGLPLPAGFNTSIRGDANCDGLVQALDAQIILTYAVGLPTGALCVGTRR